MRRLPLLVILAASACAPAPTTSSPSSSPAPVAEAKSPSTQDPAPPTDPKGADPAINDSWRGTDVEPLIGRLEDETREIYVHRAKILEAVGVREGQTIADVGAGSGFMSVLFAERVGAAGSVVAIDINPILLERIDALASARGLPIDTREATQAAAPLAANSVDLVFICDTYHHFESPGPTMRSIRAALRPGGQVVLVDFERIPGVTSEKMLEHVRAGKEVFRQEILDAGFVWIGEEDLPELRENYLLRFARAE